LLMTFKIIIKINKFDIRLNIYDGMWLDNNINFLYY